MELKAKQSNVAYAILKEEGVRFVVLVAGRRFGKTYLASYCMFYEAMLHPNVKVWYVAPTYKQAKDIAWDILKHTIPREWRRPPNESELSITLLNGSKISLKGADNPDSLRGPELKFIVFDEYADIKANAWDEVIRPTLMTCGGKALFIGTPRGYNHFKDIYDRARTPIGPNAAYWRGYQYTSIDGGYIPDWEIETAKRETDPRIFRQEYLATFETLAGRVYYRFDRSRNIAAVEDNGGDILVGIDFNVDPMTAVIGCRAGEQIHIFDEFEIRNSNTLELGQAIAAKYGRLPKKDKNYELLKKLGQTQSIPMRSLRAFPDPSGRARKTSALVGQTDYTILQQLGFSVYAPKRAPSVMDRLNNVNILLQDAAGHSRLFVHPRCKGLIKCLDGLTYKDGTNAPDKGLGLDHLPDALGYLAWAEFNVLHNNTRISEIAI